MDSITLEHAVEPFFSQRAEGQVGSGMGLSIVHGAAEQAGAP